MRRKYRDHSYTRKTSFYLSEFIFMAIVIAAGFVYLAGQFG